MSVYRNNNDEQDDVITRSLRGYAEGGDTEQFKKVPPWLQAQIDKLSGSGDLKGDTLKKLQGWGKMGNKQQANLLKSLGKQGFDVPNRAYKDLGVDPPSNDGIKPIGDMKGLQKFVGGAVKDNIQDAHAAKNDMLKDGIYDQSKNTQAFQQGVKALDKYGDKTVNQAVDKTKDVYSDFGKIDYDKTNFKDIERDYKDTKYSKENFDQVGQDYQAAGQYDKTAFDDLESKYGEAGQYETADYTTGDRTAQEIQKYMDPYEKLVASRQRDRMAEEYGRGNAERDSRASRLNAMGGSGAAIEQELARKSYQKDLDDWNAQSLQNAFYSGQGIQDKQLADIYREQAGEEASKQFGKQTEMTGLQGQMAARDAAAKETAAAKQAEFAGLEGLMGAKKASGEEEARQTEAEFTGIKGLMDARSAGAKEEANKTEAELAANQGQLGASQLLGQQGAQQKEMQLTNLSALQKAGAQQDQYADDKQQFDLDTIQKTQNIAATGISGTPMAAEPPKPGLMGNILSGVTAGAGLLQTGATVGQTLGMFREGGVIALHDFLYRNKQNAGQ